MLQVYVYILAFVIRHDHRVSCTILCCHLWPVWLYHNFPHYLIKIRIFGKIKLLHIKFVS